MLTVKYLDDVPEDFLGDDPEGGRFMRAYSRARVPGFELGALAIERNGAPVAIAPFFLMDFRINTMMPPGILKKLLQKITLKIAFIGHPSTDVGRIQGEQSGDVLGIISSTLLQRASLVSFKGFGANLDLPHFNRVAGLPVPVLDVQPDYWTLMKHKTRTDLKRKLKASAHLQCVVTDGLPDAHVVRVHELYRQTCAQSDIQFEELPIDYFIQTAPLSRYILYFEDTTLLGFHQLMSSKEIMYCKYIGMDYAKSREYKLYFALMLEAVDICIRERIGKIDFGVTSYHFKRHLGSGMHETYNYFRHRNPLINAFLKRAAFLLEPSPSELL